MNEKSLVQNRAENAWRKNNFKGLISICTGGGKSKIFINIISKEPEKWLLVVPTITLRDNNWKEEFEKWNALDIYEKYVDKCCYKSLSNYDLTKYKGVCLDEAHNITLRNIKPFRILDRVALNNIKILSLSATPPVNVIKRRLLNFLGCRPVFKLTLEQGVALGVVAPFSINIYKIPLNTVREIPISYKKKKEMKTFLSSEYDSYNYKTNRIEKLYDKGNVPNFVFFDRINFLNNLKSRGEAAIKLLNSLNDKRVIVFSQSIKQIEKICTYTYHSKTTNENYIKFINKEINHIGVVQSINEGENIEEVDEIIIEGFNSSSKDLIQRIGRGLRKRNNHIAKIHILVSENTKQEDWLKSALFTLNSNQIKYIDNEF